MSTSKISSLEKTYMLWMHYRDSETSQIAVTRHKREASEKYHLEASSPSTNKKACHRCLYFLSLAMLKEFGFLYFRLFSFMAILLYFTFITFKPKAQRPSRPSAFRHIFVVLHQVKKKVRI